MNLPDFEFEKSLLPPKCRHLLGIDEVGRGPLAGPVTIGAFILDLQNFNHQEFINLGVRDSKLLSAQKRQTIHQYFLKNGHRFKTFSATSVEIDEKGIAVCIYSLISSALEHFHTNFDFCLIDGNYNLSRHCEERSDVAISNTQSIVKGDQKCFSIACASIVAKVDRDHQMDIHSSSFPEYGFSSHKGYGTRNHLEAIKKYGPCSIHRFSFSPVSKAT